MVDRVKYRKRWAADAGEKLEKAADADPSKEAFMEFAWRDFLMWAIEHQEIRTEFEAATGKKFLQPPRNALEAMIDKAAGANDGPTLEAFVEWVTVNYWGEAYAPERYREFLASRRT